MSKLWRGYIIQNDIKRSRLSSKTRSRSQRHNSLTSEDLRTHNFPETPYGSAPARIPSPLADALEHSGLPEVCYGSVNSIEDSIEVHKHRLGGQVKMPSVLVKSASYGERSRSSSSCTLSSGKYFTVSRLDTRTQTAYTWSCYFGQCLYEGLQGPFSSFSTSVLVILTVYTTKEGF